jgi:hypothetical protein
MWSNPIQLSEWHYDKKIQLYFSDYTRVESKSKITPYLLILYQILFYDLGSKCKQFSIPPMTGQKTSSYITFKVTGQYQILFYDLGSKCKQFSIPPTL